MHLERSRFRRVLCVLGFVLALTALLGAITAGAQAAGKGQIYRTSVDGDGVRATGWRTVGGSRYYYDSNGSMATGWRLIGGRYYYFDTDGAMVTGWLSSGGKWYFLEPKTGIMLTGLHALSDGRYYFTGSGAMVTGWQQIGTSWYYFNPDGKMAGGWLKYNGYWYYLDRASGAMATGWRSLSDGDYYLRGDGTMVTGWLQFGDEWYYFSGSGRMATGWITVGGSEYYLYTGEDSGHTTGVMAANTVIDGKTLKKNGAVLTYTEEYMIRHAQEHSSSTDYLIMVDTEDCYVGIMTRDPSTGAWETLYFWQCSPGKPSTPTVKGEFVIQDRGYYFNSGSARCFYWTQFYGNYLFHSILCYPNGSVMDGRLGMQLSHGCVRLAIQNAKWINENIPRGTKVFIY